MTRTDTPPAWDERTTLTTFLDYTRATVHAKCDGLTDEYARKAPLPGSPLVTISGLVSHVHWVEYSWFEVVFLGRHDEGPRTEDDPDREMRIGAQTALATLLANYEAQCEHYRQLVAGLDLTATAQRPITNGEHVTLRWVLMHLIEETARHHWGTSTCSARWPTVSQARRNDRCSRAQIRGALGAFCPRNRRS